MVDDPVSRGAVSMGFGESTARASPYLGQAVVHGTLLGLLDGNLQALRLAGAFGVGRRIADGAVGGGVRFIHGECVRQH